MQKITCVLVVLLLSVSTTCLFAQGDKQDGYKEQTYLLLPATLPAQRHTQVIKLKPVHIRLKSTPFDSILVVDNRDDTSKFLTYDGGYFPIDMQFDRPAALAIGEYFQRVITPLAKGHLTLLVNITRLNIANVTCIPRRQAKDPDGNELEYPRDNLRFTADAWLRTTNGRYRKIVSVDYFKPEESNYTCLNDHISDLLDFLLDAAGYIDGVAPHRSRLYNFNTRGNPHFFTYATDTVSVRFQDIDQPARSRWKSYPIVASPPSGTGYFANLDDFRDGRLRPDTAKLVYDTQDSIYYLSPAISVLPANQILVYPWVVADSGNFYLCLNIKKNQYVRLLARGNTFYFTVPRSLPDMYSLLDMEWIERASTEGGANHSPGAAILSGMIHAATANSAIKKAKAAGMKGNFRTCYIDMDSGDIVF